MASSPRGPGSSAASGRRVVLHVGAPKSGTTYLQRRMQAGARGLAAQGVHVPRPRPWERWYGDPGFRAALDLLDQDWGGPEGHARGAWERLLKRVGEGSTVISHELLAGARTDVVERVRRDLAGIGVRDVHVVYTARDLARSLPAAWQESLKQGRVWPYRRFLRRARRNRLWFMRTFDFPTVLGRWGADLPPENVHLVVVPPSGSAPDVLWNRFCAALGVDPARVPDDPERFPRRENTSLGVPEAQLMRLLNERLGGRAHRNPQRQYLVSNLMAETVLANRSSRRILLPPGAHEWVHQRTVEWLDWARATGIDVIGDLDELLPQPTDRAAWTDPDRLRAPKVLDAALDALEVTLSEAERRKVPLQRRVDRRLRGVRQML